MSSTESGAPIKGVLVDLAGVVYQGDSLLPGAIDALSKLKQHVPGVRYLTNTTRSTRRSLVDRLRRLGLTIDEKEVFSAPHAARQLLQQQGLRPLLIVHPDLLPEFADFQTSKPDAVVLGDAGAAISYDILNRAFRLLMDGGKFIAMGRNRYFRENSGLSLDAGPFTAALEYATGTRAQVVGKPDPEFFHLALADLACSPAEAVMVGDDVHDDVCGAVAAGLGGILVHTGKYRPGDENHLPPSRATSLANLSAAVEWTIHSRAGGTPLAKS
jgi:HAD superfamily hydrolase (TIGR01458 family)